MNQIKIGEFLKELRKEKGLTQEQLAEQFNVSRRSVSRWETGNNMPREQILELKQHYATDTITEEEQKQIAENIERK